LQFENGKPIRFFANIDQTGFSLSKWNLKLNCRDYDFTSDEKLQAKKKELIFNGSKPPKYFEELVDKIKKLEKEGKTEKKQRSTKEIEQTLERMKKKSN